MRNGIHEELNEDKPRVVGITGGIGSGKSSARAFFEDLNVPCIDADKVARNIHQNPLHPASRLITKKFPGLVADNGTLKRGSLQCHFAIDKVANDQLKSILKPFVMEQLRTWTDRQRKFYVVWESALLLEEQIAVDRVLVVDTPDAQRIARLRLRHPDWSEAQIANVLTIQMSRKAYLEQTQDVIRNEASTDELKRLVEAMHWRYMKQWG